MEPFFSVIVPVYKAELWLRQCVDSVLTQTFGDFELLLADDGSPDGCGAICDEYAARDDRVTALHQPNAGPSPARRNALARARGKYVCFADADDWVVPHWLETVKGYIDRFNSPDMVLFDFFQVDGDEHLPDLFAPEGYYDKARLEAEIYPWMLSDTRRLPGVPQPQGYGSRQLFPGYLWSKAFRRELILDHFIADDRITIFEDVAMVYECMYWAGSAYVAHDKLYAYRYLPASNLRHYRPRYLEETQALFGYLSAHLGCHGPRYATQVNVFCVRKLINYFAMELEKYESVPAAAKAARAALGDTGLARELSFRGLNAALALFLLLVRLRLCMTAALLVKLRM